MNTDKNNKQILLKKSFKEGHIIDNIPFVSQDNSIFCSYACQTMIIKYYNRNINLNDFVFNSGVSYSLGYAKDYFNYFPTCGTFLSQWPLDRNFVADLYGLEFETWFPTDLSISTSEIWNTYWEKIKSYVKNDIPVSTAVDLVSLPAFRELMNGQLWINAKKIPNFAWNLVSTAHEIVIVGFDEEKKLVYYNDPVSLNLGNVGNGIYASAPLDVFAKSVANAKVGNFFPNFIINTYKEKKPALSDEIIFRKSHDRNIQKIRGNPLFYDEKWRKYPLGINALNEIIKDFESMSEEKNKELISTYKLDSARKAFMKKISSFFTKKSGSQYIIDSLINIYDIFAIEKKHAYEYLKNKSINSEELQDEIDLFGKEIGKWQEISKFYSRFYKELLLSIKNNKNQKFNEKLFPNISDIIDIEKRIARIY
jgi:hypothetical protein